MERRPGVLVAPDGGLPLTWDAEGVSECAVVTRAYWRGRAVDQLQMHLLGASGTYRIETVCFDGEGNVLGEMAGVAGSVETFSPFPTFGIVRPAVPNTRVDCSPYGQSVFADAVDAVQSVDLAYDALINEVDVDYFGSNKVGYMRTASEVSSDNSALMRNVRKHENALQKPITDVSRALMSYTRDMGVPAPDEGDARMSFDDSIVQDTEAEKKQDMAEVAAGLMLPWEYRLRWYGEDEATARRSISEVAKVAGTAGVGE